MRSKSRLIAGAAIVVAVVLTAGYMQRAEIARVLLGLPPYEFESLTVEVQEVRMDDGVMLATRVHLPEGGSAWPVVLIRDSYAYYGFACALFVRYGYACVHQDVRGRHESGGDWYPVIHEREDGLTTLAWLTEQPWQDGNIATFGSSYVGLVQWAMIDRMPPEVKTVVADVSHGDWYQIVYRNGHFIHGIMTHWATQLLGVETPLAEIASQHPMTESNERFLNGGERWLHDYITHTDKAGAFWNSAPYTEIRNAHKTAHMPVLMTGAWHDFFIDGQIEVFEELPSRDTSLLSIRNGSHAASPNESFPELIGAWLNLTLKWLDRHLRQREVTDLPTSGYLLQSNADGSVSHHEEWPTNNTVMTLHIDRLNEAGNCDGGSLSMNIPPAPQHASYHYDPLSPSPSRGGSYQFGEGVREQGSDICSRADVLSFESASFANGLTLMGSIAVTLEVSSDAPDSAFSVRIQEKLADGRVLNIREDITSLNHAHRISGRPLYAAGTRTQIAFSMPPIQWILRPGSRLRLDVSSSSFPVFNAFPNSTALWSETAATRVARQQLFGGQLILPVL